MAKLASLWVHQTAGGVTFSHEFPYYVSSRGVFSAKLGEHEAEVLAFIKGAGFDVEVEQQRGKEKRLASRSKSELDKALISFGKAALEGERETRRFVYFDPNTNGTVCPSANGAVDPPRADVDACVVMGTRGFSRHAMRLAPDVALVDVTRTKTKIGGEAFVCKRVRGDEENLTNHARRLCQWSTTHVDSDAWGRYKTHYLPATPENIAAVLQVMDRFAQLTYDTHLTSEQLGEGGDFDGA